MVPPDDQMLNQSKLCHLLAKFATNASGAMLLLNLIQVTESISGSVVPLAMFIVGNFIMNSLVDRCSVSLMMNFISASK